MINLDEKARRAAEALSRAAANSIIQAEVARSYQSDRKRVLLAVRGGLQEAYVADTQKMYHQGDQVYAIRMMDGSNKYMVLGTVQSLTEGDWYGDDPDFQRGQGSNAGTALPLNDLFQRLLWLPGESAYEYAGRGNITQGPYIFPKPLDTHKVRPENGGGWVDVGPKTFFTQVVVGDTENPGSYGAFINTSDRERIVRELSINEEIKTWGDVPFCLTAARAITDTINNRTAHIQAGAYILMKTEPGHGAAAGFCNPTAADKTLMHLGQVHGQEWDFAFHLNMNSVEGDGDIIRCHEGSPTGGLHFVVRVTDGVLRVAVSTLLSGVEASSFRDFGGYTGGPLSVRYEAINNHTASRVTVWGAANGVGEWGALAKAGFGHPSSFYTTIGNIPGVFAQGVQMDRAGVRTFNWEFPRPSLGAEIYMAGRQGEVGWIMPHPDIPNYPWKPGLYTCISGDVETGGRAEWMFSPGVAVANPESYGEEAGDPDAGLPSLFPSHDQLSGLDGDDHAQYLNETRLLSAVQGGVITTADLVEDPAYRFVPASAYPDLATTKTQEDLSAQVNGTTRYFVTGAAFEPGTLEVTLNSTQLRSGIDFSENTARTGFEVDLRTPTNAAPADRLAVAYRPA